jgi:hypothetical protein
MDRSVVKISGDRMLTVNGKRFFPIGARHVPKGADPMTLKKAGFNCIRWMAFANETIDRTDLSGIKSSGLMYYPYLYDRADLSENRLPRMKDLEVLADAVKNDPLLLCYEQRNEPSYIYRKWAEMKASPQGMKEGSDHLRSLDPDHPIRLGHGVYNLVSTIMKFNASADIIGCNPYPVHNPGMRQNCGTRIDGKLLDTADQTISAVGLYTDKMMRAAAGRPVWMQLQAGSNEDWYNPELYTPELAGQGIYPHDRLFPSYYQMRFMAFDAIVHGATAMEWFMHGLGTDDPAWTDVKKVISEIAGMQDILSSPDAGWEPAIKYMELGFGDWTGVKTLAKKSKTGYAVIAVNTQFDPMKAVFSFPETAGIKTGSLTEFFSPYEVKIFYI